MVQATHDAGTSNEKQHIDTSAKTEPVKVPYEQQVREAQAELLAATKKGDWAVITKIAQKIAAIEAEHAKEVAKVKAEKAAAMIGKVQEAILAALKPLEAELEVADGVFFAWDFAGEPGKNVITRLTKVTVKQSAPKAEGAKTGGAAKDGPATSELLKLYGEKEYKDGVTFQAAHDATTDGNARYAVRKALLKLHSA